MVAAAALLAVACGGSATGDPSGTRASPEASPQPGETGHREAEEDGPGDGPPSASAEASGAELAMARGGFCWTDPDGDRVCGDSFGVVTGHETLEVPHGEPVRIVGAVRDAAIDRVGGTVYALSGEPEERGGVLVWTDLDAERRLGDVELPEIALDVPPGEYALELRVELAQGEVSYGVRIEVR